MAAGLSPTTIYGLELLKDRVALNSLMQIISSG